MPFDNNQHFEKSSYRERLLEHLLISELLKLSWKQGDCSLEISRPEVDRSGYDLIAETDGCIRHVQLKTSAVGSATREWKIQSALCKKPSGCVIVIYFDPTTLALGPFLYFGAAPGERLPTLDKFKIALHTKANSKGKKEPRPALRKVPLSAFRKIGTIVDLYDQLFDG